MVSFARPSLESLGTKIVPAHGVTLGQLSDLGDGTRAAVMRVMETVTFPPDYSSIDAMNAGPGARMVFSPSFLHVQYDHAAKAVHLEQDAGVNGVEVDVRALGGDGLNDIRFAQDGETLLLDADVEGVAVSWGNSGKRFAGLHLPTGDADAAAEAATDVSVSFEPAEDSGGEETSGSFEESASEGGGGDETPPPEPEAIESLAQNAGGGYGLDIDELLEELPDPLLDRFDEGDPLSTSTEEPGDVASLKDMALRDFEPSMLPEMPELEEFLRERVAAVHQVDGMSRGAPVAEQVDAIAKAEATSEGAPATDFGPSNKPAEIMDAEAPQVATRELHLPSVVEAIVVGKITSLVEHARLRAERKLHPTLAL